MRNRTYGGVRGRKTKVGRKLLRFPPTRFMVSAPRNDAFFYIFGADFVKRNDFREHKFYPYFRLKSGLCVIFPILRIA